MVTFLFILLSSLSFGAEGDLTIELPYYHNSFAKWTCDQTQEAGIPTPLAFQEKNLRFEELIVSITLDRALLLANYTEHGQECRYNAVFAVDKRKFHRFLTLQQSQSFSSEGDSLACDHFKNILDQKLARTAYKIDHDYVAVSFGDSTTPEECDSLNSLSVFKRIRRR